VKTRKKKKVNMDKKFYTDVNGDSPSISSMVIVDLSSLVVT
jgi:hypothetical protein